MVANATTMTATDTPAAAPGDRPDVPTLVPLLAELCHGDLDAVALKLAELPDPPPLPVLVVGVLEGVAGPADVNTVEESLKDGETEDCGDVDDGADMLIDSVVEDDSLRDGVLDADAPNDTDAVDDTLVLAVILTVLVALLGGERVGLADAPLDRDAVAVVDFVGVLDMVTEMLDVLLMLGDLLEPTLGVMDFDDVNDMEAVLEMVGDTLLVLEMLGVTEPEPGGFVAVGVMVGVTEADAPVVCVRVTVDVGVVDAAPDFDIEGVTDGVLEADAPTDLDTVAVGVTVEVGDTGALLADNDTDEDGDTAATGDFDADNEVLVDTEALTLTAGERVGVTEAGAPFDGETDTVEVTEMVREAVTDPPVAADLDTDTLTDAVTLLEAPIVAVRVADKDVLGVRVLLKVMDGVNDVDGVLEIDDVGDTAAPDLDMEGERVGVMEMEREIDVVALRVGVTDCALVTVATNTHNTTTQHRKRATGDIWGREWAGNDDVAAKAGNGL